MNEGERVSELALGAGAHHVDVLGFAAALEDVGQVGREVVADVGAERVEEGGGEGQLAHKLERVDEHGAHLPSWGMRCRYDRRAPAIMGHAARHDMITGVHLPS